MAANIIPSDVLTLSVTTPIGLVGEWSRISFGAGPSVGSDPSRNMTGPVEALAGIFHGTATPVISRLGVPSAAATVRELSDARIVSFIGWILAGLVGLLVVPLVPGLDCGRPAGYLAKRIGLVGRSVRAG